MENTLSPEQKKQLASWSGQRDSILLEIANKKTELDKLVLENKDLAFFNSEITKRIQQSEGRLSEMQKREEERLITTTVQNADLESRKSRLQSEVSHLEWEIEFLSEKKKDIQEDISSLSKIHDSAFSRAGEIENVVSQTVALNASNAREIVGILTDAGSELKRVIEAGARNVEVTNKAISDIPKIIVDLHKDVLERRRMSRHKIS